MIQRHVLEKVLEFWDFLWKLIASVPNVVAKVYLFFICQFSIIRIVRMVCRNDLFLYAREPDHNGN